MEAKLADGRFEEVPVEIRGVRYPSLKAAADALDVHYTTVQGALDRGTLEKVGLVLRRGRRASIPVEIDGVRYPSATQASRATGVTVDAILRRYRKAQSNAQTSS